MSDMHRTNAALIAVLTLSFAVLPAGAQGLINNGPRIGGAAGPGGGFGGPGGGTQWVAPGPVYGGGYGGYGGYGYQGRPLGSYGNIGNPYGAGLYNNPYYGVYGPIGAPLQSPLIYGAPVPVAGGYYRLGRLGAQYWQSPSGYYYPWGAGAIGIPQQVYYVQQGNITQSRPPIPTELGDMEKYLNESKDKGRVDDSDYQHLYRRLHDLRTKYDRLAAECDGLLDQSDEESLRRDVGQLSGEISQRVHPAASSPGTSTAGKTAP